MDTGAHPLTDAELFETVGRATVEILRDILPAAPRWGASARREGHLVAAAPINITLGLTGDLTGHLSFGLEPGVAKALAEAMVGDPLPELDPAALGALCELTALIAGFARGDLEQRHLTVHFTPPIAATGDHVDMLWHGIDPIVAPVETSSGTVQVSLGVRQERPAPSALRVLVVDDMKFVRYSLSKIIAERGWTVAGEAENGEEAVQRYMALRPDVVTMDITMPVMDGIAACKAIVAADPDARILMLTAMGQMDLVVQAMHAGAKDFVTKPFKKDRVCAGIEGVVSGKSPGLGGPRPGMGG